MESETRRKNFHARTTLAATIGLLSDRRPTRLELRGWFAPTAQTDICPKLRSESRCSCLLSFDRDGNNRCRPGGEVNFKKRFSDKLPSEVLSDTARGSDQSLGLVRLFDEHHDFFSHGASV